MDQRLSAELIARQETAIPLSVESHDGEPATQQLARALSQLGERRAEGGGQIAPRAEAEARGQRCTDPYCARRFVPRSARGVIAVAPAEA